MYATDSVVKYCKSIVWKFITLLNLIFYVKTKAFLMCKIFSSFTISQVCQWHPTPVLLPGKSRGRKSLVGCSPWGRSESGTTERLHFHISLSCIGGGHGNPLQCSCLENPRDCGAWWAAVYGVTQSRTPLKWLSSSSSIYISPYLCVWKKMVQVKLVLSEKYYNSLHSKIW